MSIETAQTIWLAIAFYLGAGGVFALYFVLRGVDLLDKSARRAGFLFRLFLLPGAAALWPLLLARLLLTPGGSKR